ncbi:MAG: bifunctional folylpolyglutamate synthase/dihydrofolate synthase [Desulfobulbaceae bacterium]|nr:bifunctional folylpolyglutamate synthase/dihydrofolate synthase [Desulfobulbaceae bacterium]
MAAAEKLRYRDAWNFLDRLQFFKIKLGLDSMNAFMASLHNPHLEFPCIHIGGTNGKGSVGATLLSILTTAGYKVGFYTSPHLSSVRERFRIGGTFISRDEFAAQADRIINILNGRQITYFEFTTAIALLWFADRKVDLAILEVGLGGRLDATNIVTPLVSVITNVSMDHEQYLGNTITAVAAEKAGIIKPGVPVVTGTTDKEALKTIVDAAEKRGSPLYVSGRDFTGAPVQGNRSLWSYKGIQYITDEALPLNMKGQYQVDNASLALAALEVINARFPVTAPQIRQGLAGTFWPGRLEEFWWQGFKQVYPQPPPDTSSACHFLLDGAHNPDGATALKKSLEQDFVHERLILVWASMADKDVLSTLMQIAPLADTIIFTRPDQERSAKPAMLMNMLPDSLQQRTVCIDQVDSALDHAMAEYTPGAMICVAGSLYLVGRVRQILCGEQVDDQ